MSGNLGRSPVTEYMSIGSKATLLGPDSWQIVEPSGTQFPHL